MELLGVAKDATRPISVKSFLEQWDASVIPGIDNADSENNPNKMKSVIASEMNIAVETVEELSTVCGQDTLKNENHPMDMTILKDIPENIDLMTVRIQEEDLQKRASSETYKCYVKRSIKQKKCDLLMTLPVPASAVDPEKTPPEFLVQYPDVVLTVHVHNANMKKDCMNLKANIDQTFLVLGCEKLTDLRDKITCVNDLALAGDLSENPDQTPADYAKDIYKSGFFYFEGCFYNDFRDSHCQDYSNIIRDWAQQPGQGIGPMYTAVMEDTSFLDLNIRLGQPYVYVHQGDCEHLILFSDIRILNKDDKQDVRDYPRVIQKRMKNKTKCRVCQMHAARWMAYNSEHSPENPSFFCEQCFRALHYDENGVKIGDFQAFRYFDSSAVI